MTDVSVLEIDKVYHNSQDKYRYIRLLGHIRNNSIYPLNFINEFKLHFSKEYIIELEKLNRSKIDFTISSKKVFVKSTMFEELEDSCSLTLQFSPNNQTLIPRNTLANFEILFKSQTYDKLEYISHGSYIEMSNANYNLELKFPDSSKKIVSSEKELVRGILPTNHINNIDFERSLENRNNPKDIGDNKTLAEAFIIIGIICFFFVFLFWAFQIPSMFGGKWNMLITYGILVLAGISLLVAGFVLLYK